MTAQPSRLPQPASMADLHYELGKLVEDGPGYLVRPDNGARMDTTVRHLQFDPIASVDMTAVERLSNWARDYLDSLPAERREQLSREWNDG